MTDYAEENARAAGLVRRAGAGGLPPGRQPRRLPRVVQLGPQLPHVLPRLVQQVLQPGLPAEARRPGAGADPRPVLADAINLHHLLLHQGRDHPREQRVQGVPVVHAEVRQRVVVQGHAAAEPLTVPPSRMSAITAPW